MTIFTKNRKLLVPWVGLMALGAQNAAANATFNSSASLTYSIVSITNLSHANQLDGLTISASFTQAEIVPYETAGFTDSFVKNSGDGSVIANNPDVSLSPLAGSLFAHEFAVSGHAGNGSVESHHFGTYSLGFENLTTDSYSIVVSLAYQLNPTASGQLADSHVSIDWYSSYSANWGSYFVAAGGDPVGDPGPVQFSFTLGANASETVNADVAINANLAASPVPLPAAVWTFLAGLLGVLGAKKRKTSPAASA